jgi:hypothetical protein
MDPRESYADGTELGHSSFEDTSQEVRTLDTTLCVSMGIIRGCSTATTNHLPHTN